jgi:Tol biopolymer transport system component
MTLMTSSSKQGTNSPITTKTPLTTSALETPDPSTWKQGRLAFVARSGNSTALYTLDLSREQEPRLIYEPETNSIIVGPVWSPDNGRITFYDLRGNLQVIPAKVGANPVILRQCTQPFWSNDGRQIICKSSRNGNNLFEIVNANSGSLIESTSMQGVALVPSWSPVDNSIVYAIKEDNRTSIWKLSNGLPTLLVDDASENYAPVWSPDGQRIAYQSTLDSSDSEIWVMNKNNDNPRRITFTPPGFWSRGPAWSPDGNWIAFVSDRAGSFGQDYGEIFVVSILTGEVHQVTHTGGLIYDWRVTWGE